MCPVHSHPQLAISRRQLRIDPYVTWVRSVCCASSLFHRDNESSGIKCPESYTLLSASEKSKYLEVLRHYIHLGFPERFENCDACSVSLATVHHVSNCRNCPEILERFLSYLGRTDDTPWTSPESTIITVSSAQL
ncbi:hypothetical protein ALC60_02850 [Trachymyrmex zeteki]|uniref:Uncharacterized protein n=1 Tax=Mycetomoellerius zeteki TaxID=64791 RepID=A0A151XCY0_9HYME|nr:hypothetical protein ALC60_02850 [Trachymyrmex zeteki]